MDRLSRRSFLASAAVAAVSFPRIASARQDTIAWHDVKTWGVEGKGFTETLRFYDRFPAKAEKTVPAPVWDLSRHSAGMLARFETDAAAIHARWTLYKAGLSLPHMPASGVSGLDLYARDEQGHDRWLAATKPTQQKMEAKLTEGVDPLPGGKRRLYTVYLPLYNGIESLEI